MGFLIKQILYAFFFIFSPLYPQRKVTVDSCTCRKSKFIIITECIIF